MEHRLVGKVVKVVMNDSDGNEYNNRVVIGVGEGLVGLRRDGGSEEIWVPVALIARSEVRSHSLSR